LGHHEGIFWTATLPEALMSFLDHWDRPGAEIACVAFLEKRGYTVNEATGERKEGV